jgi:hypothetical protein
MAITVITCQKGIYFFKIYLVEVVLEGSVIVFRDLFLALMPTKICTFKNIATPPPKKKFIIPQTWPRSFR